MITALDTNVLLHLLIPDARSAEAAQRRLDEAQRDREIADSIGAASRTSC